MSGRVEGRRRRGPGVSSSRFDAARGPGQMPPRLYIMGSRAGGGRKLNGVYLRFALVPACGGCTVQARRQETRHRTTSNGYHESHSMHTDPNYVLVMRTCNADT